MGSDNMDYFWETLDTIAEGLGFSHYGGLHLGWLTAAAVVTVVSSLAYRAMGQQGRDRFRKTVAALLVADELFKLIPAFIFETFELNMLPFHLCSINLFVIAWHVWKPGALLDNFLYTVCIPGALAALLFPSWTKLPGLNYMCIHSFTVHILLVLYPVMLTAGGDIKPRLREVPKCLLLLAGMAALALVLNLLWDTNFMFLMYANTGNPLKWFETAWGSHLYGFPVIIAAVILVMHTPWVICGKLKKKNPKI